MYSLEYCPLGRSKGECEGILRGEKGDSCEEMVKSKNYRNSIFLLILSAIKNARAYGAERASRMTRHTFFGIPVVQR